MIRHCLAFATVAVCSSVGAYSPVHAEPRAIIELFTSQGCSSCPAADKLLGQLTLDPSLISITVPIDYWDYLGWKDTLADPRNSARQQGYAHVRGDGQVYTPQVVVSGSLHALGSDRTAIEVAIKQSRENGVTLALPVTLAFAGGRVSVSAPDGQHRRAAAPRSGSAGWPRRSPSRSGGARTRAARSPITTWCAAGSRSAIGPAMRVHGARPAGAQGDGIDGVAVLVQSGTSRSHGRSWARRSPPSNNRRHGTPSSSVGASGAVPVILPSEDRSGPACAGP